MASDLESHAIEIKHFGVQQLHMRCFLQWHACKVHFEKNTCCLAATKRNSIQKKEPNHLISQNRQLVVLKSPMMHVTLMISRSDLLICLNYPWHLLKRCLFHLPISHFIWPFQGYRSTEFVLGKWIPPT